MGIQIPDILQAPVVPSIFMWLYEAILTDEQQKKFNTTLEAQIAEGKAYTEAAMSAMMGVVENNPHTQQAQSILQNLNQTIPQEMQRYQQEFLSTYDKRMGKVTGLLEDYGTQALKDVRTTFGEAKGSSMQQLVEQGLTGGGVASSIGHGFATREADALARVREQAALVKANSLYDIEAGRAEWDAALQGNVYDAQTNLGQGLADFEGQWAQTENEAFAGELDRGYENIYAVQNVPPNKEGFNQLGFSTGSRGG
jgi:hypothetical protein